MHVCILMVKVKFVYYSVTPSEVGPVNSDLRDTLYNALNRTFPNSQPMCQAPGRWAIGNHYLTSWRLANRSHEFEPEIPKFGPSSKVGTGIRTFDLPLRVWTPYPLGHGDGGCSCGNIALSHIQGLK